VIFLLVPLCIAIARIANARFFSPQDIDGQGLTEASAHIKILQALLQNTLEQVIMASGVYFLIFLSFGAASLFVLFLTSFLFFLGRILFFRFYALGAP